MMADSDPTEGDVPEGVAVFPLIPVELGVHPLLLALLHSVVFLDGSADNVIDSDAAAEALEYIATYLQRLDGPELQRVREDMESLASYARDQQWDRPEIRFLKEFLLDFGVEKDEE